MSSFREVKSRFHSINTIVYPPFTSQHFGDLLLTLQTCWNYVDKILSRVGWTRDENNGVLVRMIAFISILVTSYLNHT
jgi:hypothetical protein